MLLALRTSGGTYSGIPSMPESVTGTRMLARRIARAGNEMHVLRFIGFAFLREGNNGGRKNPRRPTLSSCPLHTVEWKSAGELRAESFDQAPSAFSLDRSLACEGPRYLISKTSLPFSS